MVFRQRAMAILTVSFRILNCRRLHFCAIPNSPTYYDPINNKDHTLTRRNLILKNLKEDGKITQQEYEAAINEEITLNMPEKDDTVKYNYVDTYAYYCATRALMENEGFSSSITLTQTMKKRSMMLRMMRCIHIVRKSFTQTVTRFIHQLI